jgi:hypothetical protein
MDATVDKSASQFGYGHVIAAAIIGAVLGGAAMRYFPALGIYTSFEECVVWELRTKAIEDVANTMLACDQRFPVRP